MSGSAPQPPIDTTEYAAVRAGAGLVELGERALLLVAGP